jgi:hypothetical protein
VIDSSIRGEAPQLIGDGVDPASNDVEAPEYGEPALNDVVASISQQARDLMQP